MSWEPFEKEQTFGEVINFTFNLKKITWVPFGKVQTPIDFTFTFKKRISLGTFQKSSDIAYKHYEKTSQKKFRD